MSQSPAPFLKLALATLACVAAAQAAPLPKLPPQVPYLNPPSRYVVGGGIGWAVGNPDGDWVQLAGAGYTNHNLLEREHLSFEIDGHDVPVVWEMKRAARTGLYYGAATAGGLRLQLIDFAPWGQNRVARCLAVENPSAAAHRLRVFVHITPRAATGIESRLSGLEKPAPDAVVLRATAQTATLFNGDPNTIEGLSVISFSDHPGTVTRRDRSYVLTSALVSVASHASVQFTVLHAFPLFDETMTLHSTQARPEVALHPELWETGVELAQSIAEWQQWYAAVEPNYRLEKIGDERARLMVEGGLAVIKTNQSVDGGFAANLTFFPQGFTRDTILGLRAMSATGHTDELKRWLTWFSHKFGRSGHIFDASVCAPTLNAPSIEYDMGNIAAEGPAICVLLVRDYLAQTHDFATVRSLDHLLRYCLEVQLQQARANGYRLGFNGDETEVCGAVDIGPAGTLERLDICDADWAFSSVALCAASLDFYRQYLLMLGEDPAVCHSTLEGQTLDLPREQARLIAALDRDFWRTDVPGLGAGFHDAFRIRKTGAWPLHRIANLTVMPVYWGAPYPRAEQVKDVAAIAHYFDPTTGFLQLVPEADTGFDGHDLGYLLWGLVATDDPRKDEVYHALVNGPTNDCWGAFHEAYGPKGEPNDHDLRTMETGVNLSALARYWKLGAKR